MRTYTLGTDHRDRHDFTRILIKYGIEVLFDVRRVPESGEEHFTRGGLDSLCSAQGISYVFLGNELGGPRDRDYRAWMATDSFKHWFGVIRSKLEKRVCCILCAERTPRRCHRRIIGDELARDGIDVVHLLDETSAWQPTESDRIRQPQTGSRRYPAGRPKPRNRRRP